jgi:hypothetical protein
MSKSSCEFSAFRATSLLTEHAARRVGKMAGAIYPGIMGHPVRCGVSFLHRGELCFNFKRRRVPGPAASIPVTKCPRTRKYVSCRRNRFFFPSLSVLHYCQHAPFFRPAAGSSLSRAHASTHGVARVQGSAVSICRPEKTRRRDLIHARWIPARRPRRCASERARGRITTAGRLSERKFRSARGNFLRERALARFLTSPFLPRASLVILPRLPRA